MSPLIVGKEEQRLSHKTYLPLQEEAEGSMPDS
jgi:hypothetical protein